MSEGLSIRAAAARDVPQVLDLWGRAGASGALPDTPAALEALLAWDAEALLVAELDGELIGTLIAAWDGWRGNMYRLAVVPEHRRTGVAAGLVEAAHERRRAKGARRVTALVREADATAVGAWHAAGYERDDLVARFVRNL
jgi:ribosomal protein S18 acetylase RimI-like enzyme